MKKHYVVWKGREIGVFDNWKECEAQIKNFPQAQFKSFPTRELAEKMFRGGYQFYTSQKEALASLETPKLDIPVWVGQPIIESISVDAACSGNPGILEYKGVYTRTKEVLFHKKFEEGTNNVGEFLAIVHALAFLHKQNNTLPIYSDSSIALAWVKAKTARTKLVKNKNTEDALALVARAEIWLQDNTYPNKILKWATEYWGEIPADFGRKSL